MDKDSQESLFAAHSVLPITKDNCIHCYAQNVSIVTLIKSAKNIVPRFEHTHTHYEFCLPLTPIPFLVGDDVLYFGEVGMVFSVPIGKKHGIKYEIANVSCIDIVINKDYFENLLKSTNNSINDTAIFKASPNLKTYIDLFYNEFFKNSDAKQGKLSHLSALICHELIENSNNGNEPPSTIKTEYQRGIRAAATYFSNNYEKPISLDKMAQRCGFSRNYFTESFRKMYGETPLVYLTKLRILKAKQLLITTQLSVHDIAALCGYKKVNTFTQSFKNTTGLTPTEYRNSYFWNFNESIFT